MAQQLPVELYSIEPLQGASAGTDERFPPDYYLLHSPAPVFVSDNPSVSADDVVEHRIQSSSLKRPKKRRFVSALSPNSESAISSTLLLHDESSIVDLDRSARHSTNERTSRFKDLTGWKVAVRCGAVLAAIAFLVNIVFIIFATARYTTQNGLTLAYRGSCTKAISISLWLHVAINVLSSALLSISNYCMQILSAPTRAEVDRAHSKKDWLDIGLQSVRNFSRISSRRVWLWSVLALSSVPLHLLYNSSVFAELAAYEYHVLVVSSDFLGPSMNASSPGTPDSVIHEIRDRVRGSHEGYEELNRSDCIKAYSTDLVQDRKTLVVVTKSDPSSSADASSVYYVGSSSPKQARPFDWICIDVDLSQLIFGQKCPPDGLQPWRLAGHAVEYCLSEVMEEHCKLQIAIPILVVVIFCNLMKLIVMCLVGWKFRLRPLVTTGDAIQSFLQEPDSTTSRMCLVDKEMIVKGMWEDLPLPQLYHPRGRLWFFACSLPRWIACNVLCLIVLAITIGFLNTGINALGDNFGNGPNNMWDQGFGTISTSSLVNIGLNGSGLGSLISNILIANLPQALMSLIYVFYNGVLTSMLAADEWSRFGHHRKTLRVSSPVENQRSTYYLQLPYKYGVPLLAISATYHWLVSQSIFLARVNIYDFDGKHDPKDDISTCGYSCAPMFFIVTFGSFIVLVFGIGSGFRKFPPRPPLAAGCSAAISAACHALDGDEYSPSRALKWGVVQEPGQADEDPRVSLANTVLQSTESRPGHWAFSGDEVSEPIRSQFYA